MFVSVVVHSLFIIDGFAQSPEIKPQSLEFRRQATRRMIFERPQYIPLAGLNPKQIVGFDLMHPPVAEQTGETQFSISAGKLKLSTTEDASSMRWVGGFNPFATYEISLCRFTGSGRIGLSFRDSQDDNQLSASIVCNNGKYEAIEWVVLTNGQEVSRQKFAWPSDVKTSGALRLRVQMLAVGANLFIESEDNSYLVGYPDFNQHLELRRTDLMRRFEFCMFSDLAASATVEIDEVISALTPGCGQADIRAITTRDGTPFLDQGRVWLTMTVRGRALPHPLQGVFSMNPSVFDLRFEGIIVFDMGDGLWHNELASHLFYDEASGQWRGWTTGFSA